MEQQQTSTPAALMASAEIQRAISNGVAEGLTEVVGVVNDLVTRLLEREHIVPRAVQESQVVEDAIQAAVPQHSEEGMFKVGDIVLVVFNDAEWRKGKVADTRYSPVEREYLIEFENAKRWAPERFIAGESDDDRMAAIERGELQSPESPKRGRPAKKVKRVEAAGEPVERDAIGRKRRTKVYASEEERARARDKREKELTRKIPWDKPDLKQLKRPDLMMLGRVLEVKAGLASNDKLISQILQSQRAAKWRRAS